MICFILPVYLLILMIFIFLGSNPQRNFYGGEEYTTMIDGKRFAILNKYYDDDGSHIYLTMTNNEGKPFFIWSAPYMSQWRLGAFVGTGQLFKGEHYVCSSLLDFRLQEYVNSVVDKIPKRDFNEFHKIWGQDWTYTSIITEKTKSLNNEHTPIFNKLSSTYVCPLLKNIQHGGVKKKNIPAPITLKTQPVSSNIEVAIDNQGSGQHKSYYEYTIEEIKDIYSEISKIMSENFTLVNDTSNNIMEYYNKLNDGLEVRGKVKMVIIQNKSDKNLYKLYYINYNYTHSGNIDYNSPLLITKHESIIRDYGTMDYYNPGAYCCKIIDYIKQNQDILKQESNRRINEKYVFIGDLRTNLWPLNILTDRKEDFI